MAHSGQAPRRGIIPVVSQKLEETQHGLKGSKKADSTATEALLEQRNRTDSMVSTKSQVAKRIVLWWWTPISMVLTIIAGIILPVVLHVYYSHLDDEKVGSFANQQWNLWFGTAFSAIVQMSLMFSIRVAYVQWMWKLLKKNIVSIEAMDAGFAATTDLISFVNWEIWTKSTLAMILASMFWLIPFTTFIAPATLNVRTDIENPVELLKVPKLNIDDPSSLQRFSYTLNDTITSLQKFLGPRTIVRRFATATATTGEILSLPPPATNATYNQTLYAPYVQCSNSSVDERQILDGMIARFNTTLTSSSTKLVTLDYFAAIPALSNLQDTKQPIQIANLTDVDGALYASNQLLIRLLDYIPSLNFSSSSERRYLTCQLFNTSYTAHFSWNNGLQNVNVSSVSILNPVPYPNVESDPSPLSQVSTSYSAVMLALAEQLTGSVAFYQSSTSSINRTYSSIRSQIAQTVLLGSSDFNNHFKQNHMLGQNYGDTYLESTDSNSISDTDPLSGFSDQRLQDIAHARNRSLHVLISELSKNVTLSLLADSLLAPSSKTQVAITQPATVYAYQWMNFWIANGVAIGIAFVANLLGAGAFGTNKASYDTSFSSFACSTQGIHFSGLGAHTRLGALPLDKAIRTTRLQFYEGDPPGMWGYGRAGQRYPPLM